MDRLVIEGGTALKGEVYVGGAKNAALPIMAAAILADGECTIANVPFLKDVETMVRLLSRLGVSTRRISDAKLQCRVQSEGVSEAPYDLVSRMRASICVLGPLLAKRGHARVGMPGGCVIGSRPLDLHLKGLRALGAEITVDHGDFVAHAKRLRGKRIYLAGPNGPTVLGTETVMMAAVLADGETIIEHAACEPEVTDLANFLIKMGASIRGAGTPRIVIRGVRTLKGVEYRIIPDRIEAGTLMLAVAITNGDAVVHNVPVDSMAAVLDVFETVGMKMKEVRGGIHVRPAADGFSSTDVTTLPYPGFPTDLQAQIMALLVVARGTSKICEKVYPERFKHVAELNRMGAQITQEGAMATVHGVGELSGTRVDACDLRASAALVLGGLVASGTTEVRNLQHIDRGYERIEEKLQKLGARIWRERGCEVGQEESSRSAAA